MPKTIGFLESNVPNVEITEQYLNVQLGVWARSPGDLSFLRIDILEGGVTASDTQHGWQPRASLRSGWGTASEGDFASAEWAEYEARSQCAGLTGRQPPGTAHSGAT